jgi:hypothetical protein
LKSADLALYKSKADGRNCVRFFMPEMDAALQRRLAMEKAIRDIQAGGEPPHVIRQPEQNKLTHLLVISDLIEGVSDWKGYTRAMEQEARERHEA